MAVFARLYKFIFTRLRGRGFGLGIFNKIHGTVWRKWLQPDHVEINGLRLYLPARDEGVSDSLRFEKSWEPEVTAAFHQVIRTGMTVVDVGANIGYHALLAARLAGPGGRVAAFEPDLDNIVLLNRNIAFNRCGNITVYPYAVGANLQYARISLCPSNTGAHSTAISHGPEGEARRVVMVSLDEFLEPELHPDVLKIDIEGGELAALEGMKGLLRGKKLKTIFIECHPQILAQLGKNPEDVLGILRPYGFTIRQLDQVDFLCTRI